ncbi:MAG TPA: hypothetical protein P5266_03195, partial [Candidatus Fermentibacter sp.]|nr:hypothetical protein [Candidatus Fermentibacter sp.]
AGARTWNSPPRTGTSLSLHRASSDRIFRGAGPRARPLLHYGYVWNRLIDFTPETVRRYAGLYGDRLERKRFPER